MDDRLPVPTTFRVLGPHERGRFTSDAWGHLLALNRNGSITAIELEHIIDRALLQFDGRIGLMDLRSLLDGYGIDDPDAPAGNVTIH